MEHVGWGKGLRNADCGIKPPALEENLRDMRIGRTKDKKFLYMGRSDLQNNRGGRR
jgi:hypothetical protein